jgi:ligand-binding sensor domain-containing protein/AraC-like DNA-binding protein
MAGRQGMPERPCLDKAGGFGYKNSNMPTEKAPPPDARKIIATMFILIVTAGRGLLAAAGGLQKEYDRWVRRTWTTENGLPQDTVYALAQGSDGCLWIGSDGGLACFDGSRFTVFRKNSTLGLMSDSVTALCPGGDGSLWVGTFGGGLLRCRGGKFARIEGLDSDRVWALHQDETGTLWIGTADRGAYCLAPGRAPALLVIDGVQLSRVTAICGDGNGTIWMGTPEGLLTFRKRKGAEYLAGRSLAGTYVYCLFVDGGGGLWVGTTAGLLHRGGKEDGMFTAVEGPAAGLVRAIGEDALGRLWIGGERGVTVMEPGRVRALATPTNLAGDAVMVLCRDRGGDMWVGTSAGGLKLLKRNEVSVYSEGDGLSGTHIQPVCEDDGGGIWAGAGNGALNHYSGGRWRALGRPDGLSGEAITSLAADPGGGLWIGTRGAGLQCLANGKITSFRRQEGLAGDTVLCLHLDREGTLRIGSDGGGLNFLRRGDVRCGYGPPGLGLSVILAIGEDGSGNLLAGSERDGLFVLRQGAWRRFGTADGLAGDTVYAIHVDGSGDAWLGTSGGLSLLRRGRIFNFHGASEPLNGAILQILEDESGFLWMSSSSGIMRVDRAGLEGLLAGNAGDVRCRRFTEMEGLASSVCSGGFQPAGCRDRSGRLWFPTRKGLAMIDPRTLAEAPPPAAWIERAQVDGRSAPLAGKPGFPAGAGRCDFYYAAAALADPQQLEFSTRLQGLEERWGPPVRERSRHFAGLPGGAYAFQVRARSRGSAWSTRAANFSFVIRPHFQRTAWFYLLLLAGGGALAAGLLVHRQRRARRRRQGKYRSSGLSEEKTQEYLQRLVQVMERDKPYLDPELNLGKLAGAAAIPAKHLSQVINERYGLNFNDFVNRFRVEEAKRRLLEPAARDFKLLRIAFESGFNSKSVFNGAFRRHAGLSPSEFRRLLGGGEGDGNS